MTHASDIREQTLLSYVGSSAASHLPSISARQNFWCEVPGSYVSVAQFKVLKDLRLVDCSAKEIGNLVRFFKEDWTPEDTEKQVWSDINSAFSKPVERGDDSIDYIPTQIITETFKLNGFNGIAYKSSYGENGLNVALFDIGAADVINCGLYRVKDVSVTLSQQDNPYFISKYYEKPKASIASAVLPDAEGPS